MQTQKASWAESFPSVRRSADPVLLLTTTVLS